jgi:hypothetical protein
MPTQLPAERDHDPHADMEQAFIREFLRDRGLLPEDLKTLPEAEAHDLMVEASKYASARLCEMEARAHFVEDMHGGSPPLG